LSAGALPQTPLGSSDPAGKLTALPQIPYLDFRGLLLREKRKGEEMEDLLLSRYIPSRYILDKGLHSATNRCSEEC